MGADAAEPRASRLFMPGYGVSESEEGLLPWGWAVERLVIVEGAAEIISDHDVLRPVWEAYKAKYSWDLTGESMFAVRPRTAFAFIEKPQEFEGTATRWRFA